MSRVQMEISLGILFILATSSIILFFGLREEDRMAQTAVSQRAKSIEVGAELFDQQCSRCHGTDGRGLPTVCPPLNDRFFFERRMTEVGWSGSLEDYIVATVSSGRIVSTRPDRFAGQGTPAMPSFAEQFGGPLREDQIRNIAAFIVNWEETATEVLPLPTPSGPPVGSNIAKQLPEGDPQAGQLLSEALGCVTCHITSAAGPTWLAAGDQPGIGTRAAERISQPDYAGVGQATTPEQYLFESIVTPQKYLVPGYSDIMPKTYSVLLSDQDMANVIAYLLSLK